MPIFAMFLDFSLDMLCELGGSNPLLYSALHIGQYSNKEVSSLQQVFFTKLKNIEAHTSLLQGHL